MQNQEIVTLNNKEPNFLTLSEIKISGSEVVATTSHELCVQEDKTQLSSLIHRKTELVEDKIEVTVGRFTGSKVFKKEKVVELDNSKVIKLIQLLILDVFEWFGRTDISRENCKSLAHKVYDDYYWFKISELKLFAERLKGGYWKQVHNMSPAVFMERLSEFASDSMEIREQVGNMNTQKDIQPEVILSDENKADFRQFVDSMAKKYDTTKEDTEKIHKNAEKTNNWHRENEAYLEWLKNSEMSEMDCIKLYNEYLKRK